MTALAHTPEKLSEKRRNRDSIGSFTIKAVRLKAFILKIRVHLRYKGN
ncbi:hypothetical protein SAMD00020551_4761 [Mesobacillus selenatarsenatis SF-1]|uniref:Uncharacterized protein n=1 Tax=Mesobacillus selenatarsenatis (strain DSM 18680 / JCM 14380 / FERM P-15431 / SF-1) TaxID=1321606 RepID=A0A0A8X9E6_MESS1|nr:hypothetical protein SAMD00020551_4761 [Mesobacillus selenatarsenatis SF-1]